MPGWKKFHCSGRKWLNPASSCSTGALQWHVTSNPNENGLHLWPDTSLEIRDCTRAAVLDFGLSDSTVSPERRRQAAVRKLNLLIDALLEMRAAVRECPIDAFPKSKKKKQWEP